MKSKITSFFLFVLSMNMLAQQRAGKNTQHYDSVTIQQTRTNHFELNGEKLSRSELHELLLSNPESAEEFAAYKKAKRATNTLLFSSAALYVSSLFILNSNPEAALAIIGVGLGGAIVAIPFSNSEFKHLYKAIWLYNRSKIMEQYVPV